MFSNNFNSKVFEGRAEHMSNMLSFYVPSLFYFEVCVDLRF